MQKRTNLEERYKLGEVLGRGGMGVVYKAYDTTMKREVALKTILDIENQTTLELFYKECGTLAGMVHPNIISIYDLGEFKHEGVTKPFFVMPLLPGATLEQLIKDNSPRLTVEGVIEIIGQACRGLHAAHEMGLVHRDVKPSNIFVLADGSVKIIDFGIARQAAANTHTTLKGTLPYMPPEQIQMKPPTAQGDQYSLAVVCYEALARRRPFRGTTENELVDAILHTAPPPISELNQNVKYAISQVAHKALAKQAWHRFQTVKEFGEALLKACRGEPLEFFDTSKIKPRLERASSGFDSGDYDFASEVLSELEGEGYLDQGISLLRRRVDQAVRQRRVRQLLDSANRYFEAGEYPLALRKIQEGLELDPENTDVLSLKNRVEKERRARKIDEWIQLARRHLDNQSFRQAREALDNILKLKPNDTAALGLMADIDRREKDFSKAREKKSALYQAAMQAWERGEITAALSKLDHLMVLERESPEGDSERSGTYQGFYNQVRSEHDALKNSYEEARRDLAAENFEAALKICGSFLTKYPNHALFQALNFDVEERQRQKLSAFIAEIDRRADEEPDLGRRYSILEEAATVYPDEKHFQTAIRLVKDKRDLVNSIVNKAHFYEERQQFNEALDQWQIIKSIHARFPGLHFEVDRLQNRRDQQVRQTARTRAIEDIERQLDAGNHERALATLRAAMAEFPEDAELPELEKLVVESGENAAKAAALLSQARELSENDKLDESLAVLRQARQLDSRNSVIHTVLVNSLLEVAGRKLGADWENAEPLIAELLELQPNNPAAMSLQSRLADRKQEDLVSWCLVQARRLQREEDFSAALAMVQQGLNADPKDQRLQQLRATLLQKQAQAAQPGMRTPAVQAAAAGGSAANSAPASSHSGTDVATPPPETSTVISLPREAGNGGKRLETAGDGPPLAAIAPPLDPSVVSRGPDVGPPKPNRRGWLLAAAGAGAILLLVGVSFIVDRKPKPAPSPQASAGSAALVKVTLHSNQSAATISINGKPCGNGQCRVELAEGSYQVAAALTGYGVAATTLKIQPGQASPPVMLSLTPQLPTVLVTTNLDNGSVGIDQQPPVSFQNGEAQLPQLEAGDHVAHFKGEQYAATFNFSTAPGKLAEIRPVQSKALQMGIVSVLGPDARLYSNMIGASLTVDDKGSGRLEGPVHDLNGLAPTHHEITLTPASGPALHLSFLSGPAPAVVAFIGGNKDIGILQIDAGEDDATVYIDNSKVKSLTKRGGRLDRYLSPGTHTVRVEKEQFQPVAEQTVELKVGQSAKVTFIMNRVVLSSSLAVRNAPPGAEIRLNGRTLGTVGIDGGFASGDIPPGRATVTMHKDGFKPHTSEQIFLAGNKITLDGKMQATSGTLKVDFSPADSNPRLTIKREGEDNARPLNEFSSTQPEGAYVVNGTAAGYLEASAHVKVEGGGTVTATLVFNKVPVKAPEPTRILTLAEWERTGGFEKDGGYFLRKGGGIVLAPTATGAGLTSFTARVQRGRRLEWYADYEDDKNYVLFQLDDDHLTISNAIGGVKKPVKLPVQIKHDQWVVVNLEVSAHSVKVNIGQVGKKSYDSGPVDHPLGGRFAFRIPGKDELMLNDFRYPAH